ncbi:MAG: adenosylmethionine--8-amino-7-oxononanoate transaminase [Opitutales bacterium]|nr:adenosylmethionine--8-amino-7-oxononanoate transaminase [Opitutales bacterium]
MIWRPFTQEKITPPSIKVVKGNGLYLYTDDGRRYADMISSWWVNIHGHANKEIAAVIAEQAATLEHVIFAAFTHQPAEELIEKLKTVLPKELNRFFFSDDGSTAVEVALKLAYQFFKNRGDDKRKIYLHFEGAYHGDTYGSMSASGKHSMYHFNFLDFFFDTIEIKAPEFYDGVDGLEQQEDASISELERNLERYGQRICALVVEPLLQGARGMVMHRVEFLERVVKMVREYGILVIFDEVFTGFYRTGRFFAMDYLCEKPDFICLSKGLTGGFLPLALTVTTKQVYERFLSNDLRKTFIHGHSYTANPIACAAACRSFEILTRENTIAHISEIKAFHKSIRLRGVQKRRTFGTMTAFDLPSKESAKRLSDVLLERGIFLRPLGNMIYLLPPYCITREELEWVYHEMDECLSKL